MSMFRKRDEGFTLVELMVVVLIIGILVAIAIPVFNIARANAQTRACISNLRMVDGAVEQWRASQDPNSAPNPGSWTFDQMRTALTGDYVQTWPTCPAGGTYGITADAAAGTAFMTCTAAGHTYR